jgi:hypothetical protein
MNIREGALASTAAQDKVIRDYMDSVRSTVDRVLSDRERISKVFLMKLLSKFESQNLSTEFASWCLSKKGVTLTAKYIFDEINNEGGWFEEKIVDKKFVITINMAHCVLGYDEFDHTGPSISQVDWEEFYSFFIHEYKHFVQFLLARANDGVPDENDATAYFDRPHEQQAWAEGYLEKLKHQLQTTNSAVILNFLRTNGLSNSPSLYHLKQANPSAWKQIMKQAVLAAIRDANQKQ